MRAYAAACCRTSRAARCAFRPSAPRRARRPLARAATVTTLRGVPAARVRAFIRWHLRLGFSRLYLYFDEPRDAAAAAAAAEGRRVRVVRCDGRLRHEWSQLRVYGAWGAAAEAMVEVRQMYNAEHALRAAHAEGGVEWLVHLDSDELFYLPSLDVAPHFAALHAAGCKQYLYPIHEGVPEAVDAADVFGGVTLFRRHPSALPDAAAATPDAARALHFWRRRRPEESRSAYFLGSAQGKSAVRVEPGVRPMSVHAFQPAKPADVRLCWAAFAERTSPFGEALRVVRARGEPCILHCISCSFTLWREKYALLGQFGDTKPGGAAAGGESIAKTFHADSRDVIASADLQAARDMYVSQVCLLDQEEAERQVAAGVCMRIEAVRDTLPRLGPSGEELVLADDDGGAPGTPAETS
ncbi:hypothetical protein AB1Y20_005763 [Prymnesium parvum]|uniref:Glycosyltransferase family 92 protein n=1 Tax=Prymnesium parvum TaxID=97485 RepID=A0AB34J2Y9_PRYPA